MPRRASVQRKMSMSEKSVCAIVAGIIFATYDEEDEDSIIDAVDVAEKILNEIDTRYVGDWE
jgi:hypothetical protein